MDCEICGGVVGTSGPGELAVGQFWAARGGDHWEHKLVEVKKNHFALLNPRDKLVVFEDAENLHDEFFYVGCDTDGIELVICAACAHGEESELDMEVGDLQSVLYAAWRIMTPEQQEKLLQSPEVVEVMLWQEEET